MLAIWTRRQTFIYIPDDDDQVEVVYRVVINTESVIKYQFQQIHRPSCRLPSPYHVGRGCAGGMAEGIATAQATAQSLGVGACIRGGMKPDLWVP